MLIATVLGIHVRVSFLVIHVVHGVVIIMSECKVVLSKDSEEHTSQARFHVTVRTQINKSVVYFIVRRNVKFGYSEC